MGIIHLTADAFDDTVGNGRTLVDFWADWCPPCKMVAPIIEELAVEYEGKVIIAKVDVDSEGGLATRFEIMSIPTIILFRDGDEVKRFVGVQSKETLQAALST